MARRSRTTSTSTVDGKIGRTHTPESSTTTARPSASAAEVSSSGAVRKLVALAIPTFGQLIAEPLFILIDTAIVGHVSDSALAGLSLGSNVILTAVGLCIFLAYSTTSQVARLLGAGRKSEGLQAGVDGLWLALAIGIVLGAALLAFAEPVCFALGGRDATLDQAVCYARLVALGVPGMLMVYAANGIFRGLQRVRITLVAAVTGAVVNTLLDVLLVIGLGWGIAGSGVATAIAQWLMCLMLIVPAVRWAREGGARMRPRLAGIAHAGFEGAPLFFRTLALRVALMASVAAAASMGTEVLAGYQVVNATWNLALNVLDSFAIAGQTLVGQQIGARRYDRARELTRVTARTGLVAGVAVGVLFVVAGLAASPAFSENPAIQQLAAAGMVAIGVLMPLQGWMWALDGILMGAGDFRYLAAAVGISAVAHVAVLAILVFAVSPLLPNDLARIACLWAALGLVLMGGRAVANGLRVRTDVWMRKTESE